MSSSLASIIQHRFSQLHSDQSEIFQDVEFYHQLYRCAINEDEHYPWDYQLVDPQIFPIMRAHLARLNPSEAKILLTGANSDLRQVNQDVVNWEMNEILLTQVIYRVMFRGLLAGRGYLKSGWKYSPAVKVKTDHGVKLMKEMVNRADLCNVRFQDMFIPNRNIPELSSQPYIIERVSIRFGEMLDDNRITDKKGEKKWKDEALEKIKKNKLFVRQIDYGVDLPQDESVDEEAILRSQYVGLLRMQTLEGDEYFTFEKGDEDIINTTTECEYWHGHYNYIDFAPFPEDDEFFSMGIVQPNADLQVALTSSLNQLLTNARKAGNPMWMVGSGASQTPDHVFVNRPDGVVRVVGDINQVQQLQWQDKSDSLISVRGNVQNSIERTSGISSLYASGVADQGQVNKTAKGAEIIHQNIDQNLQLLISLFGAQILKTAGEHFLELNPQYMTEKQMIEITGKRGQIDYIEVAPEQISANYKVRVSPERFLKQSPAIKQASLLNMYETLKNSKYLNKLEMERMIVDAYPEAEDADNLLIDPEDTANEAIRMIMKGIPPQEPKYTDDSSAIIAIVQKYMLEMPDMSNEMVEGFTDYIRRLKLNEQAQNKNLIVDSNEAQALQPGSANLTGMTEDQIMQSMQMTANPNPTASLPITIPKEELGTEML